MRPRFALEWLECRTTPSAGDLDLTFSDDGQQVLDPTPFGIDGAEDVIIQPDGKIVVAGFANGFAPGTDGVLVRLNADGSPDTTFDGDGIAALDLPGTAGVGFRAVALQADGKIVATGHTNAGSPGLVARFNADGSLDATFGTAGVALTSLHTYAIAVQTDGKVVVGGGFDDGLGTVSFGAARFHANGTPDHTFDGDGVAITTTGPAGAAALDMLVQPDGKILLGGYSRQGGSEGFALVRYNPNGSPDRTFGGDGLVTTPSGIGQNFEGINGLALTPDGKIVAAGATVDQNFNVVLALLRYRANGSLDTTFGGDGKIFTAIPNASVFACEDVALQADGKIVVVGGVLFPGGSRSTVSRYNANGSLDATFIAAQGALMPGIVEIDLTPGDNDGYLGVAVQADGRIVAVGVEGFSSVRNISVIRYEGTPVANQAPTLGVVDGDLVYVGTAGRDAVIFRGGPSGTVAVFQNGIPIGTFSGVSRVVAHGLGGNDILLADVSIPTQLYGGTGNDWLRGGRAADAIFGDRGRDVILGGAGGDRLRGGGGADVILGGRGTDLLVGGAGIDLMIDETGEDQLVGNAGDILIDGFALIDPTSTALERLFGKLIWNAAGGRRLGTPRPA
jgi:uncharacterized delta-60 repeat protein